MYSQADIKVAIESLVSDRYNMLSVLCGSDEQHLQPSGSLLEQDTFGTA